MAQSSSLFDSQSEQSNISTSICRSLYCIPEVVDAGEVVLGVDVDTVGVVIIVVRLAKTRTQLQVNWESFLTSRGVLLFLPTDAQII